MSGPSLTGENISVCPMSKTTVAAAVFDFTAGFFAVCFGTDLSAKEAPESPPSSNIVVTVMVRNVFFMSRAFL